MPQTSLVLPYPCYLRVYEPLSAFRAAERTAWERYLDGTASRAPNDGPAPRWAAEEVPTRPPADLDTPGADPPASASSEASGSEPAPSGAWPERGAGDADGNPERLAVAEQRERLAALVAGAWLPPPPRHERRQAYVLRADSQVHLCPAQPALRCWQALHRLLHAEGGADQAVGGVLTQVLPAAATEAMTARTSAWHRRHPDAVAHIRTARWRVPMAWFLPFGEEDRQLDVGPDGRRLRYRCRMAAARQRLGRAHSVLRRVLPQGVKPSGLRLVGRWLEEFHPHSWVELDYGGLVRLLDSEALAADQTAAELGRAIEAARTGDLGTATTVYAALDGRWRALEARGRAS